MTDFTDSLSLGVSSIKFKLIDPLGRAIPSLKYQVKQGSRIVAEGATDGQGDSTQFTSDIGFPISIAVQRFLTSEMKVIKEVTPWQEVFPIVLVSGKVLEQTSLVEDEGAPGDYERQTYVVQDGDTLESVAQQKGVPLQALADLNELAPDASLSAGQVLKIPLATPASTAAAPAPASESSSEANAAPAAPAVDPMPSPDGFSDAPTPPDAAAPPADADANASSAQAGDKYSTPAPPPDPGYSPLGGTSATPATAAAPTIAPTPTPAPVAPTPTPAPVAPVPAPAAPAPHAAAAAHPAPAHPTAAPVAASAAGAASASVVKKTPPPAAPPPAAPPPSGFQIVLSEIEQAWTSFWDGHRGSTGSPKSGGTLTCSQACIALGSKGPLIEELNIRLMGFGGTLQPQPLLQKKGAEIVSAPMDVFTTYTEKAVKQFQRDYMKVAETGRVCGNFLAALDEFRSRYPIDFNALKCQCHGGCDGFGNLRADSSAEGILAKGKPIVGLEYPGMHRSIYWVLRAAMFYVQDKDTALPYKFRNVSSGYRCWHRNKQCHYVTSNHMGRALDIQFQPAAGGGATDWRTTDKIRQEVFVKRMNARLTWPQKNIVGLELGGPDPHHDASTWVHADVREFEAQYQNYRFFVVNQAAADGDAMIDIAKSHRLFSLVNCQGLVPSKARDGAAASTPPAPAAAGRLPISSLRLSAKGLQFIKDFEHFQAQAEDSSGNCTIGYGHQIATQSCSAIRGTAAFAPYAKGLSESEALDYLKADVARTEKTVHMRVQVPMFQHEYDALVSLIFNLTDFEKCPRLLAQLNTGKYDKCCDEFADITNHGLAGLVKRRQAEMNMFHNNVYDSQH